MDESFYLPNNLLLFLNRNITGKLEKKKKRTLTLLSSMKRKNREEAEETVQNNIIINPSVSNYNKCRLDDSVKRQRLSDQIKTPNLMRYQVCKKHTQNISIQQANQWKIIFQANSNEKEAGVTILLLDKIDIKVKASIETKKSLHNSKMFRSPGVRTQVPSNIGTNYIRKDIQKQKENS